jgi:hypothetical protein
VGLSWDVACVQLGGCLVGGRMGMIRGNDRSHWISDVCGAPGEDSKFPVGRFPRATNTNGHRRPPPRDGETFPCSLAFYFPQQRHTATPSTDFCCVEVLFVMERYDAEIAIAIANILFLSLVSHVRIFVSVFFCVSFPITATRRLKSRGAISARERTGWSTRPVTGTLMKSWP